MKPPVSVIFLTTLIGAGQGLFLALYVFEVYGALGFVDGNPEQMLWVGIELVVALMILGLLASFFHLGHPMRAWRAIYQWRTSWLSREVIVLPLFVIAVLAWGISIDATDVSCRPAAICLDLAIGMVAAMLALLLYVCTAMIYVAIKCIKEWHSPLTVINYLLLGLSSGFTLSTALAGYFHSAMTLLYVKHSIILIVLAFVSSMFSFYRNKQIKENYKIQVIPGLNSSNIHRIEQNNKFDSKIVGRVFQYSSPKLILWIERIFLLAAFVLPCLLIFFSYQNDVKIGLFTACFIQYIGLMAERWLFFAQASHPQSAY
jgi:DMSO reductase anchor subunit